VAVSGGIDSVTLLRILLDLRSELGIVLALVHFNHKLRGAQSDRDQEFVGQLARDHDLDFLSDSDDVAGHARDKKISLEASARELRYGFFRHLLRQGSPPRLEPHSVSFGNSTAETAHRPALDKIATGHTLDDQAETVLMRLIRGAGLKGLGGIHPRVMVENESGAECGEIVRPMLPFRRPELVNYLTEIGQVWREDQSNFDISFTRNRVRKLLIPVLEKEFNPAVAQNLAELAEIARGEEDFWQNEVAGWMGTGVHWGDPEWLPRPTGLVQLGPPATAADPELQARVDDASWLVANASVDLLWFLGEPAAVERRIIKAIGEHAGIPLQFKHVEEILAFSSEETGAGKQLCLPLGWKVKRHPGQLVFVTPDLRETAPVTDYEYELHLPGSIDLAEAGVTIEARCVPQYERERYNPEHLLDADSLTRPLKVRNWRAGERFWPQHTKSPKKIKELLQDRHVSQPERKLWPVVLSGKEIVWMRGFPPPAQFAAKSGRRAVIIIDTPGEPPKQD